MTRTKDIGARNMPRSSASARICARSLAHTGQARSSASARICARSLAHPGHQYTQYTQSSQALCKRVGGRTQCADSFLQASAAARCVLRRSLPRECIRDTRPKGTTSKAQGAPRGAAKKDLAACAKRNKVGKKIPGAVLLSHSQLYSTIAAGVLNHRVREGNGCFNSAMSTGKNHNEEKCLSANPTRF